MQCFPMGSQKPESNNVSNNNKTVAPKPYGKIILSLKNCLLPDAKLSPTPSKLDGLDSETELDLRILGCELIQTSGILLKLPQVAMATGQVLFQRFYYSKSFVRHPMETTAMGCLYLASKIEEAPRRIRDVINVFHHIRQVKSQKTIQPMILDQHYIALKTQVIKAERRVLKELGFCVHVKHPHKIIVMYLQVLGYEKNQKFMQLSWNYMNDALRSDVFVRYDPETVASACIYLSARRLHITLPKSPAWFSIFRIAENSIEDVCRRILRLYQRPKVNTEELERRVEDLRREYQETRLKAKGNVLSGNNTPNSGALPSPSNKTNHSDRHKSRTRSRSRSRTPTKHKRSKKHSRGRSRSVERRSKKSHKSRRSSVSASPSPSHSYSRKRSSMPYTATGGVPRRVRSPHQQYNWEPYKGGRANSERNNQKYGKYTRMDKSRSRYRSRSRSPLVRSSSYDKYYSEKKSRLKHRDTYDIDNRVRSRH